MRHAISVLLENEVGALTRMTGMFSSRGYNIDSLNVAPTNEPTVSRVTLVVSGSDAAIAQLNTQLAKLVDVVNIHDMTLGDHFERELAIVKMKLGAGGMAGALALAKRFGAEILDERCFQSDLVSIDTELIGYYVDDSFSRRCHVRRPPLHHESLPLSGEVQLLSKKLLFLQSSSQDRGSS